MQCFTSINILPGTDDKTIGQVVCTLDTLEGLTIADYLVYVYLQALINIYEPCKLVKKVRHHRSLGSQERQQSLAEVGNKVNR